MNIKQKATTKLPDNVTLISNNLSYLSHQHVELPRNMTASEIYVLMTNNEPKWLRILFKIRDFLCKWFGIKSINGFDKIQENEIKIGEKTHFFTVTEKKYNKLTLELRDSHLDVCVCLCVVDNKELHFITSVKNHNFIGKFYMLPVSIVHPYIVNNLIKNNL